MLPKHCAPWSPSDSHLVVIRTGMSRSVNWQLFTDISGQVTGPIFWSRTAWSLKMGPVSCPETSVNNYQPAPHNIPEEQWSHLHRRGSLNSLICVISGFRHEVAENSVLQSFYAGVAVISYLRMGPIGCPETSVSYYHCSLRNSSEERTDLFFFWKTVVKIGIKRGTRVLGSYSNCCAHREEVKSRISEWAGRRGCMGAGGGQEARIFRRGNI